MKKKVFVVNVTCQSMNRGNITTDNQLKIKIPFTCN